MILNINTYRNLQNYDLIRMRIAHACFSFRSMPVQFASNHNYSRSAWKSVTFNISLVLYGIELLRSYNNMKICLHKNCAHIRCKISKRNSKNERCAFVHYQHVELINEHVQKAIRFSKWKTIQYFNPWRKFYLCSFSCLFLHWVDKIWLWLQTCALTNKRRNYLIHHKIKFFSIVFRRSTTIVKSNSLLKAFIFQNKYFQIMDS